MQEKNCIKIERKLEKEKSKQQDLAASQQMQAHTPAEPLSEPEEETLSDIEEPLENVMESTEDESKTLDQTDVESDEMASSPSIFA
jgi:hypothetical protein